MVSVTIDIRPEIEAGLSALASARGIAVSEYLRQIIEERIPVTPQKEFSKEEKITALNDVHNLPVTPLLSDEAISRESMYGLGS